MKIAVCELNGKSGHEAGRELLASLFLEETGDELPEILTTDRGKPFFSGSNLHFSISHTDHYVFCALSDKPVGIDAEELDRPVYPGLMRRVLSPAEQVRVNAAQDARKAFLALWVLKEATVKLTGEGLRGFPNWTDFSPEDPRILQWNRCLLAVVQEETDSVPAVRVLSRNAEE